MQPSKDTDKRTSTLEYASQRDVRCHPGPSDKEIIRFFGRGMWIAIAIPFVGGFVWIAYLLVWQ